MAMKAKLRAWFYCLEQYRAVADAFDPRRPDGSTTSRRVSAENAAALAWRLHHPWRLRLAPALRKLGL